jgi:hypothetical protein
VGLPFINFFKLPSLSMPSAKIVTHKNFSVNCLHFRLKQLSISRCTWAYSQCLPPLDIDKHLELENNSDAWAPSHCSWFKIFSSLGGSFLVTLFLQSLSLNWQSCVSPELRCDSRSALRIYANIFSTENWSQGIWKLIGVHFIHFLN